MTQIEILEELKNLTSAERLTVAEAALNLVRKDLQRTGQPLSRTQTSQQMADAAKALLSDYQTDTELTAFSALDDEDFCAKG
jgi:hypothetical protein